nr:hypothetical protein [Tanacetum cinerariifolium]
MDLSGYEVPRVLITCRSYTILEFIKGDVFDRLHDEDAVSLCCLGILQLVLLGVEAKRMIPNRMLRLENDRVGNLPAAILRPDETEARSNWWISSRAYFVGGWSLFIPDTSKQQLLLQYWYANKLANPNAVATWFIKLAKLDAGAMGNPNLQPPIERHHDVAALFNHANLSPLSLGNAFDDENEGGDDVKSQVKAQVTRILPRIEVFVNAQLKVEVLTRLSHSSRTSYAVAADLSEMELKKILIDKMEGNKEDVRKTMIRKDPPLDQTRGLRDEEKEGSMHQPTLHLNQLPRVQACLLQGLNLDRCLPDPEWFSQPRKPPTSNHDWNKTLPAAQGNAQSWISVLANQIDARSSFNELLDTPIDFSNFIMNRLGVDTLTPELLAGPTYELMRGSCNSLTELEYHSEEVYKETTDQLDWDNPEGQQYPHNLLQPLPLIPDNRGRRVILFEYFINNDLEYLWEGTSSRKYTTSVTKTKAGLWAHKVD